MVPHCSINFFNFIFLFMYYVIQKSTQTLSVQLDKFPQNEQPDQDAEYYKYSSTYSHAPFNSLHP